MPFPRSTIDALAERAMEMSCDDQFDLAKRIAANIGYALVREDDAARMSVEGRLDRLEAAVLELNPGLNWS